MLIAIEGIDGAGKGTLTRHLLERAEADGIAAASLSFPRYEQTRFSTLIAQYLNGRFGAVDEVPARFAALLYAGDRLESLERLQALIAGHRLVILDRYVASNMAYQAARLPEADQAELIAWLDETEFETFGLPRPDLTVLLATRPDVADELVSRKAARSYTDEKRDLHEANQDFMARTAAVYARLAEQGGDAWLVVETTAADGTLRPPDDIAAEIWDELRRRLNADG